MHVPVRRSLSLRSLDFATASRYEAMKLALSGTLAKTVFETVPKVEIIKMIATLFMALLVMVDPPFIKKMAAPD